VWRAAAGFSLRQAQAKAWHDALQHCVSNSMNSYVITPKNPLEQQQLAQFLTESHLPARVLTDEKKEDIAMLHYMAEGDPNDTVSEEEVMKILRHS
jgi:hypothetical protein